MLRFDSALASTSLAARPATAIYGSRHRAGVRSRPDGDDRLPRVSMG